MLGEKVPAKVTAKYLFGAPVQNATVKYKVMRSEHDSRWFVPMPWDWFYGSSYWWFAYDYNWYPELEGLGLSSTSLLVVATKQHAARSCVRK